MGSSSAIWTSKLRRNGLQASTRRAMACAANIKVQAQLQTRTPSPPKNAIDDRQPRATHVPPPSKSIDPRFGLEAVITVKMQFHVWRVVCPDVIEKSVHIVVRIVTQQKCILLIRRLKLICPKRVPLSHLHAQSQDASLRLPFQCAI